MLVENVDRVEGEIVRTGRVAEEFDPESWLE